MIAFSLDLARVLASPEFKSKKPRPMPWPLTGTIISEFGAS